MARSRVTETLLFWTMALLGGSVLAACLVLPPWLEYEAQRQRLIAASDYVADLEYRLVAAHKQIEHLEHDRDYLLRLAREEFGEQLVPGDGESVPVAPGPENEPRESLVAQHAPPLPPEEEVVPPLPRFVADVLHEHPQVYLFVNGTTRPVIMIAGGVLLLTAVVLLGRPAARGNKVTT